MEGRRFRHGSLAMEGIRFRHGSIAMEGTRFRHGSLPIEGTRLITRPFSILPISKQFFRSEICHSYRSFSCNRRFILKMCLLSASIFSGSFLIMMVVLSPLSGTSSVATVIAGMFTVLSVVLSDRLLAVLALKLITDRLFLAVLGSVIKYTINCR